MQINLSGQENLCFLQIYLTFIGLNDTNDETYVPIKPSKKETNFRWNTSLAAKGALAQRRTAYKIPNGRRGLERQLPQNMFLEPSTPSMRKGRDGGEKTWGGGRRKD